MMGETTSVALPADADTPAFEGGRLWLWVAVGLVLAVVSFALVLANAYYGEYALSGFALVPFAGSAFVFAYGWERGVWYRREIYGVSPFLGTAFRGKLRLSNGSIEFNGRRPFPRSEKTVVIRKIRSVAYEKIWSGLWLKVDYEDDETAFFSAGTAVNGKFARLVEGALDVYSGEGLGANQRLLPILEATGESLVWTWKSSSKAWRKKWMPNQLRARRGPVARFSAFQAHGLLLWKTWSCVAESASGSWAFAQSGNAIKVRADTADVAEYRERALEFRDGRRFAFERIDLMLPRKVVEVFAVLQRRGSGDLQFRGADSGWTITAPGGDLVVALAFREWGGSLEIGTARVSKSELSVLTLVGLGLTFLWQESTDDYRYPLGFHP